ncbi:MAG: RNA 2',3'-cyclic phosphodiesterase [Pirellulales bacterium]
MGRTRTFIAVEISDEIRRRAAELMGRLNAIVDDVKWVANENLHWTLQFLGDVEELEIPAVCAAVAESAAECEPFDLAAGGAGAFPSADRPRTLWIGAGQGADDMVALQKAIERRLKKLGYRSEHRRFVPHLTLGRAGRHGRPQSMAATLATLADFDAGSMLVDEVTVFASQLTREGSVYEPLSRAPLAP